MVKFFYNDDAREYFREKWFGQNLIKTFNLHTLCKAGKTEYSCAFFWITRDIQDRLASMVGPYRPRFYA